MISLQGIKTILFPNSTLESDIYHTLRLGGQRCDAVIIQVQEKRKDTSLLGGSPTIAEIMYSLESLVSKGHVEGRLVELPPQEPQSQNRYAVLEYHLTEEGVRAQSKYVFS